MASGSSALKKILTRLFSLCLVFILGISIGYLANHVFSENAKFEAFTKKIFQEEICSSTLTLHYSLAYPNKQGISQSEISLGTIDSDWKKTRNLCSQYIEKLKSFSYSRLSTENQLTLDMLLLYFYTENSLGDRYLLKEYLGPSLGIQAQLPILLAEYSFRTNDDLSDYLKLLSCIRPYFQSILEFEQKKSDAGYFMSDTTLDRILEQCNSFIENPDSNYLQDIFESKLVSYSKQKGSILKESEQKELISFHKKLLKEQVIPAYQELITGLERLRGTGKDSRGLAYFEGGRQYYLYLLQSQVGSYLPVKKMEQRLTAQLLLDCREISLILKEKPSLVNSLSSLSDSISLTPSQMLEQLKELIKNDFPDISDTSFELKYVHNSMKDFLSPAFYLTPPVDTGNPNIIYINSSGKSSSLELFTTLSHEGFPGHLYQNAAFYNTRPSLIRSLITSSGYVEGWATYAESYAYEYAARFMKGSDTKEAVRLAWLNRSVNLCIYSLLDIGIHYRGWDQARTAAFLKAFGIHSASAVSEIYQYIVETPANYLKYYWGYLNFLDLKKYAKEKQGENFDLKQFHEAILEMGPVQFPVLKKYMDIKLNIKKERNCPTTVPPSAITLRLGFYLILVFSKEILQLQ